MTILIPWIPLKPTDVPIPTKLSFAKTINKTRGQTCEIAGIDLSVECFSYGQPYVALSSVTERKSACLISLPRNSLIELTGR